MDPNQEITSSITIMGEEFNNSIIFAERDSKDKQSKGISIAGEGTY